MWKYSIIINILITTACWCQKNEIKINSTDSVRGYKIRHTGVNLFYDTLSVISVPDNSSVFYYQDALFFGQQTKFIDNKDGTITDKLTGLMWQRKLTSKLTIEEANSFLKQLNNGKYNDWRIPNVKELFSLIDYSGRVFGDKFIQMFIDTNFFEQPIGNTIIGEREIDAQTWTSTECKSLTMGRDVSRYGVNFVDGRIKAYPIINPFTRKPNRLHFRFVRGNSNYGLNDFSDNGDGTITDQATGLMWQKNDSEIPLDWKSALEYAKNLKLSNYSDWRLPNVKELQSLVNYDNNVDVSRKPSISSVFQCSKREEPNGVLNYPYYWSSTTLLDGPKPGNQAAYVCFGKATAFFIDQYVDAHGTGAVRSDPKFLTKENYPVHFGPQGDLVYVKNYVRCVRNIK